MPWILSGNKCDGSPTGTFFSAASFSAVMFCFLASALAVASCGKASQGQQTGDMGVYMMDITPGVICYMVYNIIYCI